MLTGFHATHAHTQYALSRRRLLKGAAGAALAGVAVGSGLFDPLTAYAAAPGRGLVEPIPATLQFDFPAGSAVGHVQAPGLTPPDTDPATVYNFEGAAGLAFISGNCERRNRRTGESQSLPFVFNDMRFMTGVFRGRDGHVRDGCFALV
jgi:hypothetical protein